MNKICPKCLRFITSKCNKCKYKNIKYNKLPCKNCHLIFSEFKKDIQNENK